MKKAIFYGIDFGTSNSTVAYIDKTGQPQVIPIDKSSENPYIMRSVIYFSKNGNIYYGSDAVSKYNEDVTKSRAATKKTVRTGNLIKITNDASATTGYKPDQIIEQVFESEELQTGRLIQGIKNLLGNGSLQQLSILGNDYEVEKIVEIFLKEIKRRADQYLGENVEKVILGRPVNFVSYNNVLAEKRLLTAAKNAGFLEVKLQMEPVGAAYDFGIDIKKSKTVLVFDFGGGTLDLSIVKFPQKQIIINSGIALGGDKLNSKLFSEKFANLFGKGSTFGQKNIEIPGNIFLKLQNWYSISLLKTRSFFDSLEHFRFLHSDPSSLNRLKDLVENNLGFLLYEKIDKVKKSLSTNDYSEFALKLTHSEIKDQVSRVEFERIIKEDLEDIEKLIDKSLSQGKVTPSQIDYLAITGGSSLIPSVKQLLIKRFGKDKLKNKETFTSVASGLALYGQEVWE